MHPPLRTVEDLELQLSEPTSQVVQTVKEIDGDLILLGVGGKMGPTLARMAVRATQAAGIHRKILGVSRFTSGPLRQQLNDWGIETLQCDLLNPEEVRQLPRVPNVIVMTGYKFGTGDNPGMTWAMNCYLPALVCDHFRESRIAAFSSGNVYGLTLVEKGGSQETDPLNPIGEYAMSVLGRERMYEYFSRSLGIPIALLRLNYATELRYGVLVDLAMSVWNERPIDLSMGYVNVIWQQEANAMALNALSHTAIPPKILNLAGDEILSVRAVCMQLGTLMKKTPIFIGHEEQHALLNNASASYPLVGTPTLSSHQMIQWTAEWVMAGGAHYGKPTHFESLSGQF